MTEQTPTYTMIVQPYPLSDSHTFSPATLPRQDPTAYPWASHLPLPAARELSGRYDDMQSVIADLTDLSLAYPIHAPLFRATSAVLAGEVRTLLREVRKSVPADPIDPITAPQSPESVWVFGAFMQHYERLLAIPNSVKTAFCSACDYFKFAQPTLASTFVTLAPTTHEWTSSLTWCSPYGTHTAVGSGTSKATSERGALLALAAALALAATPGSEAPPEPM